MRCRRKTPEQLLDYGLLWIREHNDTYRRVMHIVHSEVARGSTWVGRDAIYTLARQSGLRITNDREFRFSHELWSVIARYMAMMRPGFTRVIGCNRSPIDDLDLPAKWEEVMGEPYPFPARSYAEAVRLAEVGDCTANIDYGKPRRKGDKCKRPKKSELCRMSQQSLFQE